MRALRFLSPKKNRGDLHKGTCTGTAEDVIATPAVVPAPKYRKGFVAIPACAAGMVRHEMVQFRAGTGHGGREFGRIGHIQM